MREYELRHQTDKKLSPGKFYPLGATPTGDGVNFAIYSRSADGGLSPPLRSGGRPAFGYHQDREPYPVHLACFCPWAEGGAALRLQDAGGIQPGLRDAVQRAQASDRPLCQGVDRKVQERRQPAPLLRSELSRKGPRHGSAGQYPDRSEVDRDGGWLRLAGGYAIRISSRES